MNDDALFEVPDLLDHMGMQFPFPKHDRRILRGGRPVMTYLEAVEWLSVDALGVFAKITLWEDIGEHADEQRVADLIGAERAAKALAELRSLRILLSPQEMQEHKAAVRAEWAAAEAARAAERAVEKEARLTPPDPWPSFLDGHWRGTRAALPETLPEVPVVYWLHAGRKLQYIGSTGRPLARLGQHLTKSWDRWEARQCADRETAYWLEAAELRWAKRRPVLNRDLSVGGRYDRVPAQRPAVSA